MKILKFLSNRIVVSIILICVQILWLALFMRYIFTDATLLKGVFIFLSVIVTLYIINNDDDDPSYKIIWLIPILSFPVFGGLLYVVFGNKKPAKKLQEAFANQEEAIRPFIYPNKMVEQIEDLIAKGQANYLVQENFPIYNNSEIKYYPLGDDTYPDLLKELAKAKHFIFMEYFIVEEGEMFNTVLTILKQKVKEGVEVRFMYDDMGSLTMLPFRYYQKLESYGIKCIAFNHFVPFISAVMNTRDHRKITVIDGNIGFSGGFNLADEYINEYEKHGYWKDAGIMLKGDAVWNLTVMFLSMWDYIDNKEEDYIKFKPSKNKYYNSKGYVQPFDDSPLINEPIGETVYLNLINKAKDYIYINTPYLIIDNEMATALKIAAKSGVDIKIVTPYIPDKKFVHAVTKSYYESFIKDGIEIYEFTPGFMHAKTFVVDDEYGVVGSINLDFRSLYLHYECGVWLYKTDSIKSMKDDYLETLKRCHKVTMEECKNTSSIRKVLRLIIRMFAPLL